MQIPGFARHPFQTMWCCSLGQSAVASPGWLCLNLRIDGRRGRGMTKPAQFWRRPPRRHRRRFHVTCSWAQHTHMPNSVIIKGRRRRRRRRRRRKVKKKLSLRASALHHNGWRHRSDDHITTRSDCQAAMTTTTKTTMRSHLKKKRKKEDAEI